MALKFDTEVKYLKLHKKFVNGYTHTQTAFVITLSVSPQFFEMTDIHA